MKLIGRVYFSQSEAKKKERKILIFKHFLSPRGD
jgi:hypothetical protein